MKKQCFYSAVFQLEMKQTFNQIKISASGCEIWNILLYRRQYTLMTLHHSRRGLMLVHSEGCMAQNSHFHQNIRLNTEKSTNNNNKRHDPHHESTHLSKCDSSLGRDKSRKDVKRTGENRDIPLWLICRSSWWKPNIPMLNIANLFDKTLKNTPSLSV